MDGVISHYSDKSDMVQNGTIHMSAAYRPSRDNESFGDSTQYKV